MIAAEDRKIKQCLGHRKLFFFNVKYIQDGSFPPVVYYTTPSSNQYWRDTQHHTIVTQSQRNRVEETNTIIEVKELTFNFSFRKTDDFES